VNNSDGTDAIYQKGVTSSFRDPRNALGGRLAQVPFMFLEYNMNGNQNPDGTWGDPRQAQPMGAIFIALQTQALFQSDGYVDSMAMWDIISNGNYGAVGNHQSNGDMTKITPQGWYLGNAGQMMEGKDCPVITSGLSKIKVWASLTATGFALQIVNYNTAGGAITVMPSLGRPTKGPFKRVDIGKDNPNAVTTAPPSVNSLSVPSEGIVLITGGLA
jgi:hypothetical protein